MGRVCIVDIGQDGQLGETGFHVAYDLRIGMLRCGDDAHGCGEV